MKKRLLALCLAIVLIIGVMPVMSLADSPAQTLNAVLTENDVVIDGVKEPLWTWAGKADFAGEGDEKVAALWGNNALYLAVDFGTAEKMTLTLGEKTWADVSLTEKIDAEGLTGVAKNGVAEVKIDLEKAGVVLTDYEQTKTLQITLGEASLNASVCFSGNMYNVGSTVNVADSWTVTSSGSLSLKSNDPANLSGTNKKFLLEADFNITALPVFSQNNGGFNGVAGYGVYFWINSLDAKYSTVASIYNTGNDNELAIKGVKTGELNLGVKVGIPFKLSYVWNEDYTVDVYVDGQYKGALGGNVAGITTSSANRMIIAANSPVSGETVTATVTNVKFTDATSVEQKNTSLTGWSAYASASAINGGMSLSATGSTTAITYQTNLGGAVDHNTNMYLEMNLNIEELPSVEKTSVSLNSAKGGIFFYVHDSAVSKASGALIYNKNNNIYIRPTLSGSTAEVDTKIDMGSEGVSFKLGYMWKPDGTADVYINDVFVDSLGANTQANSAAASQVQFRMKTYSDESSDTIKASFTDATVTKYGKALVNEPTFGSTNLTLDGILGVNFKANMGTKNADDYAMKIYVGDDAQPQIVTSTSTKVIEEVTYHVFTGRVVAHKMLEKITAKLVNKHGIQIATKDFEAEAYVTAASAQAGTTTEMKALLEDMLNYCKYAASYKNNYTGTLPTLDAIDKESTEYTAHAAIRNDQAADSNVRFNLFLDESCDLQFKFPTATYSGYTLYVDGDTTGVAISTLETVGSDSVLSFIELKPQEYGTKHHIVVKDGETVVYEIQVSVLSYVYAYLGRANADNGAMDQLVTAMYHYYNAAETYLASIA